MKKVLLTETASMINGGQKMSLLVSDMLTENRQYEVIWAIPEEGVLSDQLKKRGIKYYLLGNVDLPAGVKNKSVVFRYARLTLLTIRKINKIIGKEKVDIIYSPGPASLPWAAVCGTMMHKPVIWHLHHMFLDGPTKKLIGYFSKWKSVRHIIAVSNVVGEQVKKPSAYKKVTVLYNPVDIEKYQSGNFDNVKGEFPFNANKNGKTIIIGQIALIEKDKKQDITLKITGALRRAGYDAYATIIGKHTDATKNFYIYLQELASRIEIMNYVNFFGFRKDIPDLLPGIDIIMIPSSFEGFPLAGLEACAAGVPVVACNVGGAREFVDVSGSGCCFELDNVDDAAKKVIDCLNNKNHYSKNGKAFASECTHTKYSDKLLALFSK